MFDFWLLFGFADRSGGKQRLCKGGMSCLGRHMFWASYLVTSLEPQCFQQVAWLFCFFGAVYLQLLESLTSLLEVCSLQNKEVGLLSSFEDPLKRVGWIMIN